MNAQPLNPNQALRSSLRSTMPALLIILLTLIVSSTSATAKSAAFDRALEAYQENNYEAAIEDFSKSIATDETPAARHNLAIAYYQLDEAGEAAWQIERAARLAPLNREYRYKLHSLRTALGFPARNTPWYTIAAFALSFAGWVTLASVAFWILIGSILLPRAAKQPAGIITKLLRSSSLVLLATALPASFLQFRERSTGIVIANEPQIVRAAPAQAAPETGTARIGERVQIIDQYQDYYQLTTEGGAKGWLHQNHLRPLITRQAED